MTIQHKIRVEDDGNNVSPTIYSSCHMVLILLPLIGKAYAYFPWIRAGLWIQWKWCCVLSEARVLKDHTPSSVSFGDPHSWSAVTILWGSPGSHTERSDRDFSWQHLHTSHVSKWDSWWYPSTTLKPSPALEASWLKTQMWDKIKSSPLNPFKFPTCRTHEHNKILFCATKYRIVYTVAIVTGTIWCL